MHRPSAPLAVALLAALCCIPSTAFALSPQVGAFGSGSHSSGNTNLVNYPIGTPECSTGIPLTFSGVTSTSTGTQRYIDIWYATSASANCQTGMIRASTTSPVCHYVTSIAFSTSPTATVSPTAEQLFGGCTTANQGQRTFYFFDTASQQENATNYTTYWTLDVSLDVTAPTAPTISGAPAGDTVVLIPWNASTYTDLGVAGEVYVYSGGTCTSGTDGSGADAGGVFGTTAIAHGAAASPFSLSTSALGWAAGSYGQSALIAIAVADTAGNISPLSSGVCVTHVQVSGFWDSYCAAHGMTDTAACANSYRGCSVALPSRREDPVVIGLGALAVGLFLVRRRRR